MCDVSQEGLQLLMPRAAVGSPALALELQEHPPLPLTAAPLEIFTLLPPSCHRRTLSGRVQWNQKDLPILLLEDSKHSVWWSLGEPL